MRIFSRFARQRTRAEAAAPGRGAVASGRTGAMRGSAHHLGPVQTLLFLFFFQKEKKKKQKEKKKEMSQKVSFSLFFFFLKKEKEAKRKNKKKNCKYTAVPRPWNPAGTGESVDPGKFPV